MLIYNGILRCIKITTCFKGSTRKCIPKIFSNSTKFIGCSCFDRFNGFLTFFILTNAHGFHIFTTNFNKTHWIHIFTNGFGGTCKFLLYRSSCSTRHGRISCYNIIRSCSSDIPCSHIIGKSESIKTIGIFSFQYLCSILFVSCFIGRSIHRTHNTTSKQIPICSIPLSKLLLS